MDAANLKRPFSFFQNFIPYYRELRAITGSALASILVARIEYWFEKKPEGFFKFIEPNAGHRHYKTGDSWTEDLAFSKSEFNAAFDRIGVSFNSKKEYDAAADKFKKTVEVPKYKIAKKAVAGKNYIKRTRDGSETQEATMYYCRYHDRIENVTWFFKNPGKSILQDSQSSVKRVSRSTVKRDTRSPYNGLPDPRKTDNPFYTSFIRHKRTHKRTQEGNSETKSAPPDTTFEHPDQMPDKREVSRFVMEWDHWKVEVAEPEYKNNFDDSPIFNAKDMAAFCGLRDLGKPVSEISERYKVFLLTENPWYAKKGYAFHVFAEDYNSFGNVILSFKSKNGNTKTDRVLDVYEQAMRGAELAQKLNA